MTRRFITLPAIALLALSLGACSGMSTRDTNTATGAAIGGAVGRSMTDTDRLKAAHTLESVRSGVPARWVNPDTGNSYVVVPTRTFDQAGAPCRDYTIDATIGGAKEKVVGTACRQPDGSWRVVQ